MPLPLAESDIRSFVDELLLATSFDDAALATLRALERVAANALTGSPHQQSGRIVRSVLHERPADGYRGLAVLEAGAPELSALGASNASMTSTTAWRWVAETRRAVSIDVNVGRARLHDGGNLCGSLTPSEAERSDFNGAETRLGLMARDITHLLVLPLRGTLASVDGMVSIEAACRPAIGRSFIWEHCVDSLQLIADIASPHLCALPIAARPRVSVDPFLPVIGPSMGALTAMLATFAQQDEPILITGPTGSGKSRLARWCHERSPRKGKPFEVLDLCAVPESLQMAELFGWKKGAFTGATRDKQGYVARAKGGTVFIDEIDNLAPRAQAGMLRVLEERRYRVLGDEGSEVTADVRFIIGTNASLREAVRNKHFREDLYYRINVLPVKLPPLKERADEICAWARYMAGRRHETLGSGEGVSITPRAERVLLSYDWPGNLRQLDNIVRRTYALALMALDGHPGPRLILDEQHVRHAIAFEDRHEDRSLCDVLVAAATSFVDEAVRRGPGALDLDLADAFKGFVLGAAAERYAGGREETFALFGRDKLAKSRNHHKVLRREMDRVERFCRAIGESRIPFSGLVSACENEASGDPSRAWPVPPRTDSDGA
ncbi:MAG: sigma 54-interacting transcriptional regulator [Polyangiaceae bacterium]|jgi:hypothetical protein